MAKLIGIAAIKEAKKRGSNLLRSIFSRKVAVPKKPNYSPVEYQINNKETRQTELSGLATNAKAQMAEPISLSAVVNENETVNAELGPQIGDAFEDGVPVLSNKPGATKPIGVVVPLSLITAYTAVMTKRYRNSLITPQSNEFVLKSLLFEDAVRQPANGKRTINNSNDPKLATVNQTKKRGFQIDLEDIKSIKDEGYPGINNELNIPISALTDRKTREKSMKRIIPKSLGDEIMKDLDDEDQSESSDDDNNFTFTRRGTNRMNAQRTLLTKPRRVCMNFDKEFITSISSATTSATLPSQQQSSFIAPTQSAKAPTQLQTTPISLENVQSHQDITNKKTINDNTIKSEEKAETAKEKEKEIQEQVNNTQEKKKSADVVQEPAEKKKEVVPIIDMAKKPEPIKCVFPSINFDSTEKKAVEEQKDKKQPIKEEESTKKLNTKDLIAAPSVPKKELPQFGFNKKESGFGAFSFNTTITASAKPEIQKFSFELSSEKKKETSPFGKAPITITTSMEDKQAPLEKEEKKEEKPESKEPKNQSPVEQQKNLPIPQKFLQTLDSFAESKCIEEEKDGTVIEPEKKESDEPCNENKKEVISDQKLEKQTQNTALPAFTAKPQFNFSGGFGSAATKANLDQGFKFGFGNTIEKKPFNTAVTAVPITSDNTKEDDTKTKIEEKKSQPATAPVISTPATTTANKFPTFNSFTKNTSFPTAFPSLQNKKDNEEQQSEKISTAIKMETSEKQEEMPNTPTLQVNESKTTFPSSNFKLGADFTNSDVFSSHKENNNGQSNKKPEDSNNNNNEIPKKSDNGFSFSMSNLNSSVNSTFNSSARQESKTNSFVFENVANKGTFSSIGKSQTDTGKEFKPQLMADNPVSFLEKEETNEASADRSSKGAEGSGVVGASDFFSIDSKVTANSLNNSKQQEISLSESDFTKKPFNFKNSFGTNSTNGFSNISQNTEITSTQNNIAQPNSSKPVFPFGNAKFGQPTTTPTTTGFSSFPNFNNNITQPQLQQQQVALPFQQTTQGFPTNQFGSVNNAVKPGFPINTQPTTAFGQQQTTGPKTFSFINQNNNNNMQNTESKGLAGFGGLQNTSNFGLPKPSVNFSFNSANTNPLFIVTPSSTGFELSQKVDFSSLKKKSEDYLG